jgi:malonyl-CoA/methylmalonyl-CoA synthetase
MSNFFNYLKVSSAAHGEAPCLLGAGPPLRYADLDEHSASMAGALAQHELPPGAVVMAAIHKSPQAVALYLACLRSGLVYLPVNPAYTVDEMVFIARDAMPRLLVCDPSRGAQAEAIADAVRGIGVVHLDADGEGSLAQLAREAPPRRAVTPRADEDTAALLYTSGTTGRPKGVPLSHRNLRSNAETLVQVWAFSADDVLLHALPVFHVHGLFVALHCALLSGCAMIFLPKFDAETVCRELTRASVMMGVPTFYTRLLELAQFGTARCAGVRLFISGSAPLLPNVFDAFERRTGHRILERYGMTETNMIASNPLDGARVPGTVGYALPGVRVRVTDGDRRLSPGTVGMLEVSGPNVFAGYLNRPDANATEFTADGWFRTGDLASLDEDGRIRLVGRSRDLIISGGYNVYPVEVERCLDQCEGVKESAVIGIPDDDLGERVVAVVVATDAAHPPAADALLSSLEDRLARYKQPRRVAFVGALPRNSMGKVRKQLLRDRAGELFAPG